MDLIIAQPFLNQKGGVQRVVLELAKEFNPIIYSIDYDKDNTFEELKEFDIRIIPKKTLEAPFFFLGSDKRRSGAVKAGLRHYFHKIDHDYDVINAHGTPSEWIANKNERVVWYSHSPNREAYDLYEWRMKKLPFIKRQINWGLVEIFKLIESKTVPKIDAICTNSQITNKRIKKYLKREDGKVIHPGVDPKKYKCENYEKFFFYPSRIVPEKRFEIAIEAFREFSSKIKGWRLVVAGFLDRSRRNVEYLEKLKELSKDLNVEFKINLDEDVIVSLYSNCYATLFCAINEDWGLTPIESMASSKPCISINEGGPKYSIIDSKTGYLVDSSNLMAQKMIEVAKDSDLNEKLGKNARKRVLENYTWEIYIKKMREVFSQISSKSE